MNITPVSIWSDGQVKEAVELKIHIVHDDLSTQATFYYKLLTAPVPVEEDLIQPAQPIATGNIGIAGEDYQNWGANEDINLSAYQYVAGKLNLTLA